MSQINGWTQERRKRQRGLIQSWQPWEKSTGPKTPDGKAQSAGNAYKGGIRPMLRELSRVLREQEKLLS